MLRKRHSIWILGIIFVVTAFELTGCIGLRPKDEDGHEKIIQAAADNGIVDEDLEFVHSEVVWESALPNPHYKKYIYINRGDYEKYRHYWDSGLWDINEVTEKEKAGESYNSGTDDKEPVFTYIAIRDMGGKILEKQYYSVEVSKHAYYYESSYNDTLSDSTPEYGKRYATLSNIDLTEDVAYYRVHKEKDKYVFEKAD